MYSGFVERIMLSSGNLRKRIKMASGENLRLKDQLQTLQNEFAQTQQVLMTLTATLTFHQDKALAPN